MGKSKRIFSAKKGRKFKRWMGILLVMTMLLNMLSSDCLVVSASQNEEVGICPHHKEHTQECGYRKASEDGEGSPCTYECHFCPIEGVSSLSLIADAVSYRECDTNGQNWVEKSCENYTEITSDTTKWNAGWYVVTGDVTINARVTVSGEVCLILMDGCTLDTRGITVNSGDSLSIYAQSEGTGSLTATASENAAGIGGGDGYKEGGTITIYGGNVIATGGIDNTFKTGGAGIGGGYSGKGGTINIHGGTITATGNGSSGIGAAGNKTEGTILITGGTVTAKGSKNDKNVVGDIIVTGGTLNGITYCVVTFVTDTTAVTIPMQTVPQNTTAERPSDPEGYVLSFFTDAAHTVPFDFTTSVNQNITIYVKCEVNNNYIVRVAVGGTETKYTSLESFVNAIKSCTSGEVSVTLLQSVDLGSTSLIVPENVTLTLDCGEFTLTSSGNVTVDVNGTFHFTGGTLLNTNRFGVTVSLGWGANFNMSGGVIDRMGNGDNYTVATIVDGSVTIMGGTIGVNGKGLAVNSSTTAKLSGGMYSNIYAPEKTVADILAEGYALQYMETKEFISQNTSVNLKNVAVVPCTHAGAVADNEDGTHGPTDESGICPYCGTQFKTEYHTPDENNKCTVCNTQLVAKMNGKYYASIESTFKVLKEKEIPDAKITLLQDTKVNKQISLNGYKTTNITLDLDGKTINGSTQFIFLFDPKITLTIEDSGQKGRINGDNCAIVVYEGTLHLNGGTFYGLQYGIRMQYKGNLYVTEGVTLISRMNGLSIENNSYSYPYEGTTQLSGGTFINEYPSNGSIDSGNKMVKELLDTRKNSEGVYYAYFNGDDPITDVLELNSTRGYTSVTVKKCTKHFYQYTHTEGTKHIPTCSACGKVEDEENCTYTWIEGETTGKCVCGSTLIVTLNDAEEMIYKGTAQKPAVTVKVDGDTPLTEDADYKVSYTNNINAGDNASVTVTGTNFNGTFTQKFSIKKATPDIGKVTAQELEDTLDVSKVILNREKQTPDGILQLIDGSTLQYGTKTYTWEFTPEDTMNYLTNTGKVDITVKDTIAPTANYQIGTDGWKKFVETISFGLFCKDYKTVEIEFTDDTNTIKGSGVAKKQYHIADKEITKFDNIEWKDYTQTIHLDTKGTYFIYVKVSDNAGNEAILNSEGIVIYEESVLSPTAFDYIYKQNKDFVLSFTMNGNTFKTLKDNKGNVIDAKNYTVDDGKITLRGAFLDTLDKGEYIYKIYMNPQGVETEKVTLAYTFTVKVKAKELTVTSATATNRDYNGTNTVEITDIALNGIVSKDDVSVDLNGVQGILSSSNAGEYDSVTLPKLTLTGTGKGNYTLVQPAGTVTTSVTIQKVATEIIVGTGTYNKTFGDGAFTLDVTDNNLEKDVQYKVTAGEDVVSVENGTVNIKKAGMAAITVSLPESANYKAATDKIITIKVAKKSGYTIEAVNKSYLYTQDNVDTIELATLLPKDCGTVTYKEPSTSGVVTFQTSAVSDGKLSYTLGSGSANDEGTITVIAETQNYEDITITVNVKLTDKIPVSIKEGMKVTLKTDTLNYGEALSKLIFNEVDFVGSDGKKVEGTLTWKKEGTKPDAGTTSAIWIFSPTNNSKYEVLEGMTAITVNKATPEISVVPTVADRVYNPVITLKDISLTGGTESVSGSWNWERANIVPSVDNRGYVAVFTPTDKTNYETVTKTIMINVTKATPYIKMAPSAAVITYGDALGVSNLAGGAVQYSKDNTVSGYDNTVSGGFAWKDASQKPVAAESKTYIVVFTPADGVNYNSVETTVTPTVQKAENAPNMPGSSMNVLNSCKKVSDVALPDGWEWQDTNKDTILEVGIETNAVAIYTGADKGNYEKEMVTIVLTRSSCEHVAGEILYTGAGEKAPTCTENGLGHKECTKCHSFMESGIVVTAFGHIHTELRGAIGATCTAGGYTGDSYCKDCGIMISGGTATGKLAHNYISKITKEPTTTEEGVKTYTCVGCGNSYTEAVSKLPEEEHKHSYTSQITKEPTCTEEGTVTYSCVCGNSYTESIPVLKHSYVSEVTKEPTATEEGVRTYICTGCGNSYTEPISKLPEEEHKHSYTSQITKEPTCTEEGVKSYSCSCGNSYTESIPVLSHSYIDWKSDETNHWHQCSNCGDKKDTATHIEDRGTVTKQPTETETGIRTYKCSVCQREMRIEAIDKSGHTHVYGSNWKSNGKKHWHECSCGDKLEESNHNFRAWIVIKQPTTAKEGVRERDCMVCGYQQTEKIPKKKSDQKDDKNKLALNSGLKVSQTGSQINIAWGKVSGASGYDIYVQYCGTKFSAKSSNQVKSGTKTKTTVKKVNKKKLDLKKSYKVYVVAYKLSGGKKVTICKSLTAHIIGRNNKKYTNIKAVTVKKNSYTLKKGKTAKIQATTLLVSKGKRELTNNHAEKFRYASSNKKIATVSANGKIKAIKKGSCIIYVYARNGYAKKIKVTVK